MREFKPATDQPRAARWGITAVAAALALVGTFLVGRGSAPHPAAAPAPSGIRYVDGLPTGFPPTPRGAGDAAAWYLTLLSAVASRPRDQVQALVTRMVAPTVRGTLVNDLMPSTSREGNRNVAQTVVMRVWAQPTGTAGDLPPGARVPVKTLELGLFGARTDGHDAGPSAGLGGGCYVHDLTMQLDPDGWRLRAVATPRPAPPPDLAGSTRDGSTRDTPLLAEVLGPDSWIPSMP
ncbi:MAG TPA: hypothetical protein VJT31_34805 [Rugosimonospora sp.]|nr:hypothetical protein [Rugosimonospora sp.]